MKRVKSAQAIQLHIVGPKPNTYIYIQYFTNI